MFSCTSVYQNAAVTFLMLVIESVAMDQLHLSDRTAVVCCLVPNRPQPTFTEIQFRALKRMNYQGFGRHLCGAALSGYKVIVSDSPGYKYWTR